MEGMTKLALLFKEARSKRQQPSSEAPKRTPLKTRLTIPSVEGKTETQTQTETQTHTESRGYSKSRTETRHDRTNKTCTRQPDPRDLRTLFIGNLPVTIKKKDILKLVTPYGTVESLRQRSAAVGPGKLPVPVARKLSKQITGTSVNYYVVMATEDSASACLELNGRDIEGRHIRVDLATPTNDTHHSVFVGNIPFNAEEEQLRKTFE